MFKYALSKLFHHWPPGWADAIPMFAPLKPEVSCWLPLLIAQVFFPGVTKFLSIFWQFFDNFWQLLTTFDNFLTTFWQLLTTLWHFLSFLTTFLIFFYCASQFRQQILWNTFYIRCAYFTPSCTWSPNYSVLVVLCIPQIFDSINYRMGPLLSLCASRSRQKFSLCKQSKIDPFAMIFGHDCWSRRRRWLGGQKSSRSSPWCKVRLQRTNCGNKERCRWAKGSRFQKNFTFNPRHRHTEYTF
jgi:hypothetical protein